MSEEAAAVEEAPNGKKSAAKKKEKKGKAKNGEGGESQGLTIAGHPRAGPHVRKAKGWGGLVAFGVTAYLSLSAGLPPDQAGLRALGAGIGGYLLGWACSVTIWRHLLVAELRALAEHADGRAARPAPATPAAPSPAAETTDSPRIG